MKYNGIFITATDTHVGKTIASLVLGHLLKAKGVNVGYMKPAQCAGNDTERVWQGLELKDSIMQMNPFFASEGLSPNVAFKRQGIAFDKQVVFKNYQQLSKKHDMMIVEGAGGLMVPLTDTYLIADLIKEMQLDVVIVARLGLGTINHTLLTIHQARSLGLNVKGVLFSQAEDQPKGVAEQTNPDVIKRVANVKILGTIPYLKEIGAPQLQELILRKCREGINLEPLFTTTSGLKTQKFTEWDKKYVWHPFTPMKDWQEEKQLVIERAQGSYLIDTDGNRYLDGVSSLWVNVHGHGHPVIDQAIKQQVNQLSHSTLLGLANTPSAQLAKELVEITPKGLDRVFYSDNGSTAVEVAIKIAYQYWQNLGKTKKIKIAHLKNSYHGDTLGSVSVGGIGLFHKVYQNLIFKTVEVDFPDCYRAPQGKKYPEYAFEFVKKFEQMLKSDHAEIAAFVVEPLVQGAAGMIMWPEGVLKRMYEACQKHNVLFIADEVATGFGRTGKMFACDHEDVVPDILCLAKGITGGYLPLAATLIKSYIYDAFVADAKELKTFFHGHTYTGNPLGCAAALANLKVFKEEHTLMQLAPKIKFLDKQLKMFYNLSSVGHVRQRGFMVGIELVTNQKSKTAYDYAKKIGARVCQKAREKGVILRPLGHVIVLMPPLSMSEAELKTLCEVAYEAIREVTQAKETVS